MLGPQAAGQAYSQDSITASEDLSKVADATQAMDDDYCGTGVFSRPLQVMGLAHLMIEDRHRTGLAVVAGLRLPHRRLKRLTHAVRCVRQGSGLFSTQA